MPEIRMPDGQVVAFPDDMPKEQIKGMIASKFPQETKQYDISTGKAALFGFGQGMTGGLSDEIASAESGIPLEEYTNLLNQADEQHGIAYPAGEMAGALAGLLTGGRLLGSGVKSMAPVLTEKGGALAGKNFATKVGTGAAIGGASGGAYGFNTSTGSPEERLEQAEAPAAFGMALGPLGSVAGAGIQRLAKPVASLAERAKKLFQKAPEIAPEAIDIRALPDVQRALPEGSTAADLQNAYNKVESAIRKDYPQDYEQIMRALQSGDLAIADLPGENITSLAKGAAQYPSGKKAADEFFDNRVGGSPDRVRASLSRNLSSMGDYYATVDDIVAKGQAKAKPIYDQAYKETIDNGADIFNAPEVQQAIAKARAKFPSELKDAPDNSVKVLDYAKRVLDDEIDMAQRAGEKNLARSRTLIKKELLNEIDAASPNYAKARATSGDYLSLQSAMEQGRDFMKTDPELVAKSFKAMSDVEKDAYKNGVVKAIRDTVDNTADGRNPYNAIFGKGAQQQRLMKILSPKEYDELKLDLQAENRLFKMRNEVLGGSPTTSKAIAAGQFAEGMAPVLEAAAGGGIANVGRSVMLGSIKKMFDGLSDKRAGIVADLLYETSPQKKLFIINKIKPDKDLDERQVRELKKMALEIDRELRRTSYVGAAVPAPLLAPEQGE